MKRHAIITTLLFLLLAAAGTVKAQQQSKMSIGDEWYYEYCQVLAGPMNKVGFGLYSISGDTTINGVHCFVVENINPSLTCENMGKTKHYCCRTEEQMLWYNEELEAFTVLHNYSAKTGDSWSISVDSCSFDVLVDSTTTMILFGEEKRVLYIHDDHGYYDGCIIEDIGHTTHYFPRDLYWECHDVMCDGPVLSKLRCFINDSLSYHFTDLPCDTVYYSNSVGIIEKRMGIDVFPTLVEDDLSVQQKSVPIFFDCYEVYDLWGKRRLSGTLDAPFSIIAVNSLTPGFYLIRLTEGSISIVHKFIKK